MHIYVYIYIHMHMHMHMHMHVCMQMCIHMLNVDVRHSTMYLHLVL